MTLLEAIAKIDALKPNGYRQEDKTAWLSSLDGMITAEIIGEYEGETRSFSCVSLLINQK